MLTNKLYPIFGNRNIGLPYTVLPTRLCVSVPKWRTVLTASRQGGTGPVQADSSHDDYKNKTGIISCLYRILQNKINNNQFEANCKFYVPILWLIIFSSYISTLQLKQNVLLLAFFRSINCQFHKTKQNYLSRLATKLSIYLRDGVRTCMRACMHTWG